MLHGFRRLSLFPYIYETNNNNEFLYRNVEKKYFDIDFDNPRYLQLEISSCIDLNLQIGLSNKINKFVKIK